jgi:hypothetical protein
MSTSICHNCHQPAERSKIARIPDHIHETAERSRKPLEVVVTQDFRHVSWEKVHYQPHNGECGLPCIETLTEGEQRVLGLGHFHDGSNCPCMHPALIERRRLRDEEEERRLAPIRDRMLRGG